MSILDYILVFTYGVLTGMIIQKDPFNNKFLKETIKGYVRDYLFDDVDFNVKLRPGLTLAADVRTKIQTEVQGEVQTEVQDEVQTEVQDEVQTEVQGEVQTEVQDEVQDEVQTEVQAKVQDTTQAKVKDTKQTNIQIQIQDEAQTKVQDIDNDNRILAEDIDIFFDDCVKEVKTDVKLPSHTFSSVGGGYLTLSHIAETNKKYRDAFEKINNNDKETDFIFAQFLPPSSQDVIISKENGVY